MGHYDDYEMHKWDDYPVMEPKTPRQEWLDKISNDTYRAKSLLRESLAVLPLEVLKNVKVMNAYGALEVALTEEYNRWKNKKE